MKKEDDQYAEILYDMRNKIGMLLEGTANFYDFKSRDKFDFMYSCLLVLLSEFIARSVKKEGWEEVLADHTAQLRRSIETFAEHHMGDEEVKH